MSNLNELDGRVKPFLITDESTPNLVKLGKELVRAVVPQQYWAEIRNRAFGGRVEKPYNVEVGDIKYHITTAAEKYRLEHFVGEEGYLDEIARSLQEGDTYYDIGAAIGTHCLPLKHLLGQQISVVAFEPDPEAYERLSLNASQNGLDILAIKAALGSEEKEMLLGTAGLAGLCPSFRSSWQGPKVLVQVCSLDRLVESGKVLVPSVIKLDVEGAEASVLDGMRGVLSLPTTRELFIEIHATYLPDFGSSAKEVWDTVVNYGFAPVSVRKRGNEYLCHFSRATE